MQFVTGFSILKFTGIAANRYTERFQEYRCLWKRYGHHKSQGLSGIYSSIYGHHEHRCKFIFTHLLVLTSSLIIFTEIFWVDTLSNSAVDHWLISLVMTFYDLPLREWTTIMMMHIVGMHGQFFLRFYLRYMYGIF